MPVGVNLITSPSRKIETLETLVGIWTDCILLADRAAQTGNVIDSPWSNCRTASAVSMPSAMPM
jgi:hypothetical protein